MNFLNFDFQFEKVKPLAISAVCFAAVFAAGYGVGKSGDTNAAPTAKRSLNYNTNVAPDTKTENHSNSNKTTVPSAAEAGESCRIKGSKSKTYHVPGGAFYEKTKAAQCFNSEEDAVAAGYKKSSR